MRRPCSGQVDPEAGPRAVLRQDDPRHHRARTARPLLRHQSIAHERGPQLPLRAAGQSILAGAACLRLYAAPPEAAGERAPPRPPARRYEHRPPRHAQRRRAGGRRVSNRRGGAGAQGPALPAGRRGSARRRGLPHRLRRAAGEDRPAGAADRHVAALCPAESLRPQRPLHTPATGTAFRRAPGVCRGDRSRNGRRLSLQLRMARPADSAGNPWRRTRRSFRFAFAGMAHMIRSQPNARIHLAVAAVACALAAWLRLPPFAWALLATMIGLVLALEALNTAIEAVVDLASPDHHELARIAKDCAGRKSTRLNS